MATCWSIEHDEMYNPNASTGTTIVLSLDDVEPAAPSATTTSYVFDYSLMATVFSILVFLWIQ